MPSWRVMAQEGMNNTLSLLMSPCSPHRTSL